MRAIPCSTLHRLAALFARRTHLIVCFLVAAALLARAHARTGDIAKIANYCAKSAALDEALADFAEAYGDQTERDHDLLVKAIKAGKVAAVEGV